MIAAKSDGGAAMFPAFHRGQYATYRLERSDGGWAAIAMRVVGRSRDGAWVMTTDIKTRTGECTAMIGWHPSPPAGMPDVLPFDVQRVRGNRPENVGDPRALLDEPETLVSSVMNLFGARRAPDLAAAVERPAIEVALACRITRVVRVVVDGPPYVKWFDLHPHVPMTGVASLSIEGANPILVTSFGLTSDGSAKHARSFDFVDLTRPTRVDHGPFALTYPSTWFLREEALSPEIAENERHFSAFLGGDTCAGNTSVHLRSGTPPEIDRARDAALERRRAPERCRARPKPLVAPAGDVEVFAHDYENGGVVGRMMSVVARSTARDRLAELNLFGCVAARHPAHAQILEEMERCFEGVIEGFALGDA